MVADQERVHDITCTSHVLRIVFFFVFFFFPPKLSKNRFAHSGLDGSVFSNYG